MGEGKTAGAEVACLLRGGTRRRTTTSARTFERGRRDRLSERAVSPRSVEWSTDGMRLRARRRGRCHRGRRKECLSSTTMALIKLLATSSH